VRLINASNAPTPKTPKPRGSHDEIQGARLNIWN
jgi:hypothetical protein